MKHVAETFLKQLQKSFPKVQKGPFGPPGQSWSRCWTVSGVSCGRIAQFSSHLTNSLGHMWGNLGQSWDVWAILGHLGPSWDCIGVISGPSWGHLGVILRPSGGHIEAIWGPSRVLWGVLATLLKPSCGHLFGKNSLRTKCFSSRRGAEFCYAWSASWPSFEPPLRPFWS